LPHQTTEKLTRSINDVKITFTVTGPASLNLAPIFKPVAEHVEKIATNPAKFGIDPDEPPPDPNQTGMFPDDEDPE